MDRIRSVADVTRRSATPELRRNPPSLSPSESEMVQVITETQDAKMRQCWDKVKCKEMGIPDTYQKVAVLILRWEESLDEDLKTGPEVLELDKLFTTKFNYESRIVKLNNKKRPQSQIDKEVATFVADYDGPHRTHLLIVYYTGHGHIVRDGPTEHLLISGKINRDNTSEGEFYPPEARWDQAETTLHSAEADVLTILDCCFASSVMKHVSEQSRSYELLAASGRDTTPQPGAFSYTRALIDSLQKVLDEGRRIDTFGLNQMIVKLRGWNTRPHVYNRLENKISRHVILTPLLAKRRRSSAVQPIKKPSGSLNIRIAFEKHSNLENEEVTRLAREFFAAAKRSDLHIRDIDWMGFQPSPRAAPFRRLVNAVLLLNKAMRRWKQRKISGIGKRKREAKEQNPAVVMFPKRRRTTSFEASLQQSIALEGGPLTPQTSSEKGTTPA